jgi:hypothetical protein
VVQGPAGFWESYQPDLVFEAESDQGPWGGERRIVWRSEARGSLRFGYAKRFAERHGWKLVEQRHYDGNASAEIGQKETSHEPAFLAAPSTVGRFESGWVREDPGTSEITPAYGYVQVSDDGSQMYMYHFWGNG